MFGTCMDKDIHMLLSLLKVSLFQLTNLLDHFRPKRIILSNVCITYGLGVFTTHLTLFTTRVAGLRQK